MGKAGVAVAYYASPAIKNMIGWPFSNALEHSLPDMYKNIFTPITISRHLFKSISFIYENNLTILFFKLIYCYYL